MEITYIGHSSFKIKGKDVSLVIDPYDPKIGYKYPKQECDILLITHYHFDHDYIQGATNYKILIDKPGEYEVSGVFINGIQTFHDNTQGSERGNNTIYLISIDGINILHLGDLGHELSKDQMERISQVDVLMIPVGGKYTIDSEVASKVISSIEPSFVIPMHYQTQESTTIQGLDTIQSFFNEMGIKESLNYEDKLKLTNKIDIPQETTIVALNPKH